MFQGIHGAAPSSFILVGGGEGRVWFMLCIQFCGENRGVGGGEYIEGFYVSFTLNISNSQSVRTVHRVIFSPIWGSIVLALF